jgi:hypothetical protein
MLLAPSIPSASYRARRPLWRGVAALLGAGLGAAASGCGTTDTVAIVPVDAGTRSDAGTLSAGQAPNCSKGPNYTDCPCDSGSQIACYTGPVGTEQVGGCKAGIQKCLATKEAQFAYGPCEGEVVPTSSNACVRAAGSDASTPADAPSVDGAAPSAAPRLVAPLSVSTVTSQQPTLRWALPSGADGAHVEICVDRACTKIVATFDATGSHGKPSAKLSPGVWFWRAAAASGSHVGSTFSSTWELVVGHRSASADTSWGATLDLNGDGFADLVIGAPSPSSTTVPGEVFVYLGSASGLVAATPPTFTDGIVGNAFGTIVRSIGDVNGDGFADLAVVAQGTYPGVANGTGTAVDIYLGSASGLASAPATTLTAGAPSGSLAFASELTGAGDLNGDGYADLAIYTFNNDAAQSTASVDVYYGSATGLPTQPSLTLAQAVAPAACPGVRRIGLTSADFNGDGFGDLAIDGFVQGCGLSIFLYLGGPGGPPLAPSGGLAISATYNDVAALALADMDGDGYPELVASVAAFQGTSLTESQLLVYAGSASGLGLFAGAPAVIDNPDATGGELGFSLASAGDVNGDGFEDVIADDWVNFDANTYLFFGSAAGFPAAPSQTLAEPNGNELFWGQRVVGLGDVNGDGYADIAVSTTQYDGTASGAVCVYLGGGAGSATSAAAVYESATTEYTYDSFAGRN